MIRKKYTILTFIIGKNYEQLHEISQVQHDVEYILVTDDDTLVSKTWTIKVDQSLSRFSTPFEKCFWIRYHVFDYCSTDICITIDGSMGVIGSLDKLIDLFIAGNYDIGLMPHPLWANLKTEYSAWIQMRKYPIKNATIALELMKNANYDFSYNGLFQLCFSIKRKTALTKNIDEMTWQMLQNLSLRLGQFDRLDQTIFSFVMNLFFSFAKVLPVSEQVVRSYAIQWYWHNSNNPNMNIFYDINKPDIKWMFNKQVQCLYLL